ncbi:MAG TPA: cell division protein SepF [Selenomonadales bacterium]|nr:cell division protein SepF [Selenomonadales bacterium]
MKFMEKVWGSLGLFETVEAAEDERPRVEEADPRAKRGGNLVNLPTAQKQVKVMVVEPFSFDDAQSVADHLRNRKPVVINLENTEKDVAKRMIDFISGTTYALNGTIQKIGNNIFLCAPNNVDVTYSSREDSMDKTILPWSTK